MSANRGRVSMLRRVLGTVEPEDERLLARSATGAPITRLVGREDDDDDDDDSDDDDDADDGDDDPDDSGDGKRKKSKKSKSSDSDDDDDDDEDTVSRAEYDRIKKRMRAADRRATAAETELREIKAGKKDAEDLKVEETDEFKAVQTENRSLRLQIALLSDRTYEWHDPEDVLRELATSEDVEIDEDGSVHGVKDALKRLAKRKPYLVKPPETDGKGKGKKDDDADDDADDDDEDDDKDDKSRRRSGSPMNGGKRSTKAKAQRQKLTEKYPALRRS